MQLRDVLPLSEDLMGLASEIEDFIRSHGALDAETLMLLKRAMSRLLSSEEEPIAIGPVSREELLAVKDAMEVQLAYPHNDFGDVGHVFQDAYLTVKRAVMENPSVTPNVPPTSVQCATCKHWQPFTPSGHRHLEPEDANRLGLCTGIPKLEETALRDEDGDRDGRYQETLAATDDLSGCSALRTNAKFSCAMWQPKPADSP